MVIIMDFSIKIRVLWSVIVALVCVSFFNSIILVKIYALFSGNNVRKVIDDNSIDNAHKLIVDQFYRKRKFMSVSSLGSVLYKNMKYPTLSEIKQNKTFVVLIWKHWKKLRLRHLYYFGRVKHDPLNGCSVKNCIFTGHYDQLGSADAVIVSLHRGQLPVSEYRSPHQRWIFLNDESPENVFALAGKPLRLSQLHNVFNWSMTYMSDSDVPVPYGRIVPLEAPKYRQPEPPIANLVPYWKHKRRDVLLAILISNCAVSYRKKLISGLKEYIQVDVHGRCGEGDLKDSCPGYFGRDCEELSHYLFYLVLENGKCMEYMTEKLFHNAYSKGSIPIIQGPSLEDCRQFLPPNSYLHVDNYGSLKDLADDVRRISEDDTALLTYHVWRNHFEVLEEHGYFGTRSVHLCRACEALNYNDDGQVIYSQQTIDQFLNPFVLCRD